MRNYEEHAEFLAIQPQPLQDSVKMELGRIMAERFFTTEWDYVAVEAWADWLGFQYIDWSITDPIDSIRFCFVRAWEGGEETFLLEYAGHDEMILSLFNKVRDEVLH